MSKQDLDRGTADEREVDIAWQLYLDRGVILPGYAGEIAQRRRILSEWADEDEPLS
ncbi:hypothetical protein [Halegenticoccus soli]|uniref:hypothetical protein n=1 Tax=Halegenticoccus soli TaxID=1985678 RepID=UPI0018EAE446|nr:hypothetical protein [Halegenticoccus soli]